MHTKIFTFYLMLIIILWYRFRQLPTAVKDWDSGPCGSRPWNLPEQVLKGEQRVERSCFPQSLPQGHQTQGLTITQSKLSSSPILYFFQVSFRSDLFLTEITFGEETKTSFTFPGWEKIFFSHRIVGLGWRPTNICTLANDIFILFYNSNLDRILPWHNKISRPCVLLTLSSLLVSRKHRDR